MYFVKASGPRRHLSAVARGGRGRQAGGGEQGEGAVVAKLRDEAAKDAAARGDAAKKDLAAKAKANELADQKAEDDAAAQHAREVAAQKAKGRRESQGGIRVRRT